MARIIIKIKEYIGNLIGKCDVFAQQLASKPSQLGISFKIIRVKFANGIIYSDNLERLGRNGFH